MPKDPIRIVAVMEAATVTGPAKNLIRFAQENRHEAEIRIATFIRGASPGTAATNAFIDAARAAELTVHVIPEERRFDLGVLHGLRKLFAESPPDIVQTHSVKSHFLMSLLSGKPRPWIAFHHGYTDEDFKMRLYNSLDHYSLRHSDRMVTVCAAFVPQLERCGVRKERVDILHNSIDPAWGPSEEDVSRLRDSLKLVPGPLRILSVGRLSHEKGHATLLGAVAEAKRLRPDVALEVLLVGDGPLRESLITLARTLQIDNIVRFIGQVSPVKPFFGVSDLMVLPSSSEGSPNVVLEALAAKLPLIATRVGGVPEIVTDRETALLVPSGDTAAMASALLEMAGDAALRARLATQGHAHVAADFTPTRYDERLLGVYRKARSDHPGN